MKRIMSLILVLVVITEMLSGCNNGKKYNKVLSQVENLDFDFKVNPETFEITVDSNGTKERVSEPLDKRNVTNLKDSGNEISWTYDNEKINVEIQKKNSYLDVSIKSINKDKDNKFTWPKVNSDSYILPLGEGKCIPSNDEIWQEYLKNLEMKVIESFSMEFFALNKKDYSIVFVMKNPFNNEITFETKENIGFTFKHEYPNINENKEYGFRIYLTKNNLVDIAKTYKNYMIETNNFKTLHQKAKDNKNIEKLYGAPHIYFWDRSVISEENIDWNLLKRTLSSDLKAWIQELLKTKVEYGQELSSEFDNVASVGYFDKYTKNIILNSLNQVTVLKEFYNPNVFKNVDDNINKILNKGIENLNSVELIDLNKKLLKSSLGDSVDPVEKWANSNTVDILKDINNSGIKNMWIGLDDWQEGFINPNLVEKGNELGYLIGTYDSYHSIHKPGLEKWVTAKFSDKSLFDKATVNNKNGKSIEGFQGVGRKLNPTLAMPSVKERVNSILDTGVKFNSWFLDTDGTGEVFDDYSPNHITTEEQDIKARIERIDYIKDEKNMVMGTEGGNDFVSKNIAFAHGIETPSFSWRDKDMSKNKESKYYVGRYYSPNGGVPELFSKQVPLKDNYKKIFTDIEYTLPLYKLVYNDSVITTHWWGWGTLKIKDDIENRMLYEILYNVPPLYHIDKYEWQKNKDKIVSHTKVWSEFSKKAIEREMTDFEILSNDKLVQMTQYGDDLKVIANFSDKNINAEGEDIPKKSLLILEGNRKLKYKPQI